MRVVLCTYLHIHTRLKTNSIVVSRRRVTNTVFVGEPRGASSEKPRLRGGAKSLRLAPLNIIPELAVRLEEMGGLRTWQPEGRLQGRTAESWLAGNAFAKTRELFHQRRRLNKRERERVASPDLSHDLRFGLYYVGTYSAVPVFTRNS